MNPNTPDSFAPIFQKAEKQSIFWEEMAILGFTESILEQLDASAMSKKDFAAKLGVSPAFVTKMIGGQNNFTLRTMVKVARALDCEFLPQLRPLKETTQWNCYRTNAPLRSLVFTPPANEHAEESTFLPTTISVAHESLAAAA